MLHSEGFPMGVLLLLLGNGVGVFPGSEEVEETHDGEVFDGLPLLFGVLGGTSHGEELDEDGRVDGPYSVGSRICSGKGTE